MKMIGTNLLATIEGKKYSRKSTIEESKRIVNMAILFNNSNSRNNVTTKVKNEIIKFMTSKAEAVKKEKEKEENKIKAEKALTKKKSKEESSTQDLLKSLSEKIDAKNLTPEEEKEVKELAKKLGIIEQPQPVVNPTPRGGEFYR